MAAASLPALPVTARAVADGSLPNIRRKESSAMLDIWEDCRRGFTGTRAILEAVERYLPAHPKEKAIDYKRRAGCAEWYNMFGRTVRGMASLPFSREPTLAKNVPQLLRDHWEDADGSGTHGNVWAHKAFERGLQMGVHVTVVDVPPTRNGTGQPLNAKEEEDEGVRPYYRDYAPEDVISWRIGVVRGRQVLRQVVLREKNEQDHGAFGTRMQERYLVYRREDIPTVGGDVTSITAQVYLYVEKSGRKDAQFVPDGPPRVITNVDRIPVEAYIPGEVTSEFTGYSPLIDLLDNNIGHFRVSNNRRWLMELCCVPTPVKKGGSGVARSAAKSEAASGETNQRQAKPNEGYGPNVMMILPHDGDFVWREPQGTAFVPSEHEIKMLEQRGAALGLAFLASDTRAAETAKAKELDSAVQNATLAAACDKFDDFVERCLSLHAQFMKKSVVGVGGVQSGGEFSTNREYERITMDPAMLARLSDMETRGQLTLETLWWFMKRAGELPDDFDPVKEKERLALGSGLALPDDGVDDPDPDEEPDDEPDDDDPDFESPYREPTERDRPAPRARAKRVLAGAR
jgi:hypothetical protein